MRGSARRVRHSSSSRSTSIRRHKRKQPHQHHLEAAGGQPLRRSGRPGDELWLLLSSDALDEKVHTPIVHFGQMEAEGARLLAPNLVACTVPDDATEGVTGVRLSVAPGGAVSPGCSMRFEVLR